jgi:Zn-dependent metalloprotease
MKSLRIVLIALMAWTLLIGQAVAGEDSNPKTAQPIQEEHQILKEQLRQQTGGKVHISTHARTGNVNFIGGDPSDAIRQPVRLSANPTAEEAARGFLSVYGSLFGIKDHARDLEVMRTKTADRGRSFVRFRQVHSGIPILGGEAIVQVDSFNNIISTNSKILPDIDVDTSPVISPEIAENTALEVFEKTYQDKYNVDVSSLKVSKPELWIYNPVLIGMDGDRSYLVWRMEVTSEDFLPINELVLVDAHVGYVVLHFNQSPTALYRKIYDHNNTAGKSLPGSSADLKRYEGQGPSGIVDVNNAYDYAGDTYNFYLNYHGRDSIDNAGMELILTTRYCEDASDCPYHNAFWHPNLLLMAFGQGESSDDCVGHEMTHGVTQHESGLIYFMQSGAINEALSDIWGEFVDLTNGRGTDTPAVRWLMFEDAPTGAGRSMSNPPAYDQPDKMSSTYYYCGLGDNGGVHYNSGVANKAAYLMTDGGTFNGITVTGLGITKVAKIFYEAQTNLLTSASDYDDLYNLLQQACANLVGMNGITTSDCRQVANALNATEMNQPLFCTNLLSNSDFESGHVGWSEYSSRGYPIITNDPATAFSGSWFAWLGGYNNAVDEIYQDVTIPSNALQANLQFVWGGQTSEPGGAYDYMYVRIRRPSDNALLSTLASMSNINTGAWLSRQYNLVSFKGQTIRVMFYVTTDSSYLSSFGVDYTALYVRGITSPSAATLVSPSGTTTNTPTFTWNMVSAAAEYLLWVDDSTGNRVQQWYTASAAGCSSVEGICSVSPGVALAAGAGSWKVQTRNTGGTGPWSSSMSFSVETVSTPRVPSGPNIGFNGASYTYSTGGASSNVGHSIQYFFDWGDGTNSGWLPVGTTSASKSWASGGTYTVKAQARCATHTSTVSSWSGTFSVGIEQILTPTIPSGPNSGDPSTDYTYSTGGSTSNFGDPIQYFFDWGDGTNSGWLPVGTTSASKSWASGGTYSVKTQARCATHTSATSSWSTTLSVGIGETVSAPSIPTGSSNGIPGTSYTYSTGSSSSNFSHSIQYFFDWGDGTNSGWLPAGTTSASKSWTAGGTYSVKTQARCATHTSTVSGWSVELSVGIEVVSTPTIPSGPSIGVKGATYSYSVGDSSSNLAHSIQYLFDWGDGTNSGWLSAGTTTASHSWNTSGTFSIKSQARCGTHTFAISTWSETLSVGIETISMPATPSGPGRGVADTTYTYSTGGSSSNLGHLVQYFFDWGDSTDSGWLPVGQTSASKTWSSTGSYSVKVQGRCSTHTGAISTWSGTCNVNIELGLQSPSEAAVFDSSFLITNYQPTFTWTFTGAYTGFKILFSTSPVDFTTKGVIVLAGSAAGTSSSWWPSSSNWKKIMKSSDNYGSIRPIYWKVVGTKADKTIVESEVGSLSIGPPQGATINTPLDGAILDSVNLPTFDVNATSNTKFRLEFSSLSDFSIPTNVKGVNVKVSDPNLYPSFQKTLSSSQWSGITKLIGSGAGYFRIKAWDVLKRETVSEVRTFSIQ